MYSVADSVVDTAADIMTNTADTAADTTVGNIYDGQWHNSLTFRSCQHLITLSDNVTSL